MGRTGSAALLCLSAVLVLAGCGFGKFGTSAEHGSAATAPAATAPADSVRIGPFTQEFSTPVPSDPAQAKVISDFREAQVLWAKTDNAWQLVAPVTSYVTGRALRQMLTAIAAFKSRDVVLAGTDRMFATRVTGLTASAATVMTCDDSTKYRVQDRRTGKINPAYTPPRNQAYVFETWHLVQLSGRWAISSFSIAVLPDQAAQPCQPPA